MSLSRVYAEPRRYMHWRAACTLIMRAHCAPCLQRRRGSRRCRTVKRRAVAPPAACMVGSPFSTASCQALRFEVLGRSHHVVKHADRLTISRSSTVAHARRRGARPSGAPERPTHAPNPNDQSPRTNDRTVSQNTNIPKQASEDERCTVR